jgi:tetratricopeptide (TPR) repeat protein
MTPEQESQTRAKLQADIAANPTAPDPYIVMAAFQASRGDFAGALSTLNQGFAAVPGSSDLRIVAARLYLRHGQREEAVAAYEKAIELDPKAIPPRLELADEYRGPLHEPDKALGLYREALAIDANNAEAQFGIGETLAGLGRFGEALTALKAAQVLDPDSAPIYLALARVYEASGNFPEARNAIERAILHQPRYVDARLEAGRMLQAMGETDNAKKQYQIALQIDKNLVPAKVGLALIAQDTGDFPTARQDFLQVLEADKDNVVALNGLAWMAANQKADLDQALTWATRAASLAKDQPDVLDTLGWVQRQRGDLPAAADTLESALKLRQSPEYYTHLGYVRADMGMKSEAENAFNAALKLAPDYLPAQDGLSKLK